MWWIKEHLSDDAPHTHSFCERLESRYLLWHSSRCRGCWYERKSFRSFTVKACAALHAYFYGPTTVLPPRFISFPFELDTFDCRSAKKPTVITVSIPLAAKMIDLIAYSIVFLWALSPRSSPALYLPEIEKRLHRGDYTSLRHYAYFFEFDMPLHIAGYN